MRRSAILLALALGVLAAADEAVGFAVVLQEVAYSQRVEYILGDGQRPFADEDQRRAQLMLTVKATGGGKLALLGWRNLAATAAVSDRGEALAVAGWPGDGVFTASHELRADPTAPLPGLPIPLTRQPCAGLARFAGGCDVCFSRSAPVGTILPIAGLQANVDRAIPGIEGGTLALTALPVADGQVVARLNPAAFIAVQDLVFRDAAGAGLTARNRRAEWRDSQGQITWTVKGLPASIEVRYYPQLETRHVDLAFADLAFGLTLPAREALRGPTRSGADGF